MLIGGIASFSDSLSPMVVKAVRSSSAFTTPLSVLFQRDMRFEEEEEEENVSLTAESHSRCECGFLDD